MGRIACFLAAFSVLWCAFAPGTAGSTGPRQLSFEDRVAVQESIERVYYAHQIGATVPFEEAVPREALESKVRTYLKQSAALEEIWQTPVTGEALRAELERMAAETRSPERLRELFAVLHDDAFLIEECLVRPVLVSRLARHFFSADERIHGAARRQAEEIRAALAAGELSITDEHPGRSVLSIVVRTGLRSRMLEEGDTPLPGATAAGQAIEMDRDAYLRLRSDLVGGAGGLSRLEESGQGFTTRALLEEDASGATVAQWTVPRISWDAWWASQEPSLDEATVRPVAASTSLSGIAPSLRGGQGAAAAPCAPDDSWYRSGLGEDVLEARELHTAVWTGTHMIIWGGSYYSNPMANGGRYDPATDTWSPVAADGAPEPRWSHAAVWTGSRMIVWGGQTGQNKYTSTGGAYDPSTDTWSALPPVALSPRAGPTGVWTGREMIVWGGTNGSTPFGDGARYDPATGLWHAMTTLHGAGASSSHTTVWTGSEMIVWGGVSYQGFALGTGGRYNPDTDTWSPVTTTGAPKARHWHTAVWTGRVMIVFGGFSFQTAPDTGGRYDPATDSWQPMAAFNSGESYLPYFHTSVWTGSRMLVWGNDGGRSSYDPDLNRWSTISTTNAAAGTQRHTAIWTGDLMIVWGGMSFYLPQIVNTGARYRPSTNTWTPVSVPGVAPAGRYAHAAVWTGSQMVVWGGQADVWSGRADGGRYDPGLDAWLPISSVNAPSYGGAYNTLTWTGHYAVSYVGSDLTSPGGRYDPILDRWLPITIAGAPQKRSGQTAVWTGSRMIVWGGSSFGSPTNTGGVYDPEANTWTATTRTGAPSSRTSHVSFWTGTEMIVWGGSNGDYLNSGALYNPATNTWRLMTTPVITARFGVSAVWTGSEMIIWGGYRNAGSPFPVYGEGARYDPVTNAWRGVAASGQPEPRFAHSAVWTGRQMIIWGGSTPYGPLSSGGRYDPASDTWVSIPTVAASPLARGDHSAIWNGSFMIVYGGQAWHEGFRSGGLYALGLSSDDDGDGLAECEGDCNDSRSDVYPGAPQQCDGVNDDCLAADWPLPPPDERDVDRDGFLGCGGDCDDSNPQAHPGVVEICNHVDDDCDGGVDEDPNDMDSDGDGVGEMCDNCTLVVNPAQEDAVHPGGGGDACEDPDQDTRVDGLDNCPDEVNVDQQDVDADALGDVCDVCPGVPNPDQEENVACIGVPAQPQGACVPSTVSMSLKAGTGSVRIYADTLLRPQKLTFEVEASSCEISDPVEISLNGVHIATVRDPGLTCNCYGQYSGVVSDGPLLQQAWRMGGDNVFTVDKAGQPSPPGTYVGTFLGRVRLKIDASRASRTICLFDSTGGDCTPRGLCDVSESTEDQVHREVTLTEPLAIEDLYGTVSFHDHRLPSEVDLSGVPDGSVKVCVRSVEPGSLYGATNDGRLLTINTVTGAATSIGWVPYAIEEMELDNWQGRTHASIYNRLLIEYGPDGEWLGDPREFGVVLGGMEWVRSSLFGIVSQPSPLMSYLLDLSGPVELAPLIASFPRGYTVGLAWDEDRDILYGAEYWSGGTRLYSLKSDGSALQGIGEVGTKLSSLEFGPDGQLYATGSGSTAGLLYRINTSTGAGTLVGNTGVPLLSALALHQPMKQDCVVFEKRGQSLLGINELCNSAPAAVASASSEAECTSPAGADVVLDGSGSTDPDTIDGHDDIVSWLWLEDAGLPSQHTLASSRQAAVRLALGSHAITLRVTDSAGASSEDSLQVRVQDTMPPALTVSTDAPVLWPPNHRMVPVAVSTVAVDLCDPAPLVRMASVISSEPDDEAGNGDGNTEGDIQVPDGATGGVLSLRAERRSTGGGRIYTIAYEAVDLTGNSATTLAGVLVPHDQGGRSEPVLLEVTRGGLSWSPVPQASAYNVVRAPLAALGSVGSITQVSDSVCIGRGIAQTSVTGRAMDENPPPGAGFLYLVEYIDGRFTGYGTADAVGDMAIVSGDACHDEGTP
jgi:N-acetylneuraminic acid mutarotase